MLSIRFIAGIFILFLFLFFIFLLTSGSFANKGCKVGSDCKQDEACIKNKCGNLSVNCLVPERCGVNATCEIRNYNIHCICKPGHRGTPGSPCEEPDFSKSATSRKKQFHLSNIEVDFPGADHHCREKGYRLARLLTKEENDEALSIIKAQITRGSKNVWLGGICLGKDLPNYWLNPVTTMDYTAFHPDNPNFYGDDERCLQFWLSEGIWAWNDDDCRYKRRFLCETIVNDLQ